MMRTLSHRLLYSNRLFYGTVILIAMLLIVLTAALQWNWLHRFTSVVDAARETDRRQTCLSALFNLQDYAWDAFAPHVQAAASVNPLLNSPSSPQTLLDQMAALPGVRRAYWLVNGQELESDSGDIPDDMPPVLAGCRAAFGRYFNGGDRPAAKLDDKLQNRVRFLDVAFRGDTLRLLIAAYTASGMMIHLRPSLVQDPSEAAYLLVLDLDQEWIQQAVSRKMDDVFDSRWSFLLWSPPPFDPSAEYLTGLGVIAFNDTVWWRGLRSVVHGTEFPSAIGPGWLRFTALYEEDPADLQRRAAYFHSYYLLLGLVDAAALGFILLLTMGMVFVRRQWLARQTAMTHLAHAIRTPVARLKLDMDTLRERRTESREEEAAVMQSIGIECGRIERAVQNAALSLQDSRQSVQRMPADLGPIIADALKLWQTDFRLAGIELSAQVTEMALPGRFDRELLVTLLDNLLDNALRYTRQSRQDHSPRKPQVAVALVAENNTAVLSVDDSDGGVALADRERIFRRFERGADAAVSAVSGLGLGLSLVKEIAEAHGGSVEITDSTLGGACFRVKLPLDH